MIRRHVAAYASPVLETRYVETCPCCGGTDIKQIDVLWDDLIDSWQLLPHEINYINRQQWLRCLSCGLRLRSMAIAAWIQSFAQATENLQELVRQHDFIRSLSVLEVNEAGQLSQFLTQLPTHTLGNYPHVDMQAMPYPDDSFDLVTHSDTLEHVINPVKGLSECRRVLRPGGICAFTVPTLVDNFTQSTQGKKPSYHGCSASDADDFRVWSEFGADVWKWIIAAQFKEYRLFAFEYPAALVHLGIK